MVGWSEAADGGGACVSGSAFRAPWCVKRCRDCAWMDWCKARRGPAVTFCSNRIGTCFAKRRVGSLLDLQRAFEFRACIEQETAYLAALRGNDDDIERIKRAYKKLEDVYLREPDRRRIRFEISYDHRRRQPQPVFHQRHAHGDERHHELVDDAAAYNHLGAADRTPQ